MDGALRGVFKALLSLQKWDQPGAVTKSRGPSAVCPALCQRATVPWAPGPQQFRLEVKCARATWGQKRSQGPLGCPGSSRLFIVFPTRVPGCQMEIKLANPKRRIEFAPSDFLPAFSNMTHLPRGLTPSTSATKKEQTPLPPLISLPAEFVPELAFAFLLIGRDPFALWLDCQFLEKLCPLQSHPELIW